MKISLEGKVDIHLIKGKGRYGLILFQYLKIHAGIRTRGSCLKEGFAIMFKTFF